MQPYIFYNSRKRSNAINYACGVRCKCSVAAMLTGVIGWFTVNLQAVSSSLSMHSLPGIFYIFK